MGRRDYVTNSTSILTRHLMAVKKLLVVMILQSNDDFDIYMIFMYYSHWKSIVEENPLKAKNSTCYRVTLYTDRVYTHTYIYTEKTCIFVHGGSEHKCVL